MYKVMRSGNKVPAVLKNAFDNYNQARSAVRKWLREQIKKGKWERDMQDLSNRTVTISFYGFSISKV